MSTITQKLYTATDAAVELSLTHGRVRQVCRWNKIGTKHGNQWLLTPADIRKLRVLENRKKKP